MAQATARRQLLKAAAGRAVPDSLVTVPGELTLDRSSSGRRFQASMSRIKIQSPPGGWWCYSGPAGRG